MKKVIVYIFVSEIKTVAIYDKNVYDHTMNIFYNDEKKITQGYTEIGNGNIWWDGVLETAERIGVKHYVVEQDGRWIDKDPFKSLQVSKDYLSRYMKL